MATPGIQFQVTPNPAPLSDEDRQAVLDNPVFGTVFTDHMVDICWSEKGGWHRPRVQPYGPIPLDPALCSALRPRDLRGYEGLPSSRRLHLDLQT